MNMSPMDTPLRPVVIAVAVAGVAALLGGVGAPRGESAEPAYRSVRIDGIPHVRQRPDFCGEACVEMQLRKLGRNLDQDYVFDQSGLDPLLGRGCYTADLAKAVRQIGFRSGDVWQTVSPATADKQLEQQFAALHADLLRGTPSILCMHYAEPPQASEHFRLIVGYDAEKDEVLYHEPAVENGAYQRMQRARLLALWPLKYQADRWTLVRLRLEPGELPTARNYPELTAADYAQQVRQLKEKLKDRGFHITLAHPFVVVGDEPAETVERRATGTVKWAVDRLKKAYFSKDPDHIITVWLFKDKASYEKHNQEFFGDGPSTPFGYYSPRHKALVMNISTGGGTLVHEIVHPFMAANFPACPSWFNEGLASLYEQCGDRDGQITGFPNWRLRGLQRAIDGDAVPTFKQLCSTTTAEFYNGDDRGTNYAQARYLCYYLQERGLLVKYYQQFSQHAATDKTGYQTLHKLLGEPEMDEFQKEWTKFVRKLEF